MLKSRWLGFALLTCALCLWAGGALAQNGGGGGGGGGGRGGRGGGGGGPGGAGGGRQGFETFIKQQLQVTDDEWKIIQPRLDKVQQLQRDMRGGGFGRGGRGGPGGNAGADQPAPSEVAKASSELRTLLENKDAKPEEIKAKLTALREAREKAKKDVAEAQKALKEVLTLRQEAVLVTMGTME